MDVVFINDRGVVIAQVVGGAPITIDAQDPQADSAGAAAPAGTSASGDKRGDHRPKVIVLGPKSRPPLPMSVHITQVVGRPLRGQDRPFVIRMDTDVQGDALSEAVAWRLRDAIAAATAGHSFALDVYLPRQYGIDVTRLSCYLAGLGAPQGLPLELRVGGELAED